MLFADSAILSLVLNVNIQQNKKDSLKFDWFKLHSAKNLENIPRTDPSKLGQNNGHSKSVRTIL